jgi:ubiquinone/menaquinone biosynthesis C-methylase UbiE
MPPDHNDRILDQFTRQAVPFANAQTIRSDDALNRIVQLAGTGPDDTTLDVACGPGLLACAFARVARMAVGVDMTPAMLDQARKEQQQRGLSNISWQQGDVYALPFPDAHFSIVSSRYAFHHFLHPLNALKEMKRVCKPGGRVVVADSAPAAAKADAFNTMERLRDPSHTRALAPEEMNDLFAEAGLGEPRVEICRYESEMEELLARSFPREGDADRIRKIFADSIASDALDMSTRANGGKIFYSFPLKVFVAHIEMN